MEFLEIVNLRSAEDAYAALPRDIWLMLIAHNDNDGSASSGSVASILLGDNVGKEETKVTPNSIDAEQELPGTGRERRTEAEATEGAQHDDSCASKAV